MGAKPRSAPAQWGRDRRYHKSAGRESVSQPRPVNGGRGTKDSESPALVEKRAFLRQPHEPAEERARRLCVETVDHIG